MSSIDFNKMKSLLHFHEKEKRFLEKCNQLSLVSWEYLKTFTDVDGLRPIKNNEPFVTLVDLWDKEYVVSDSKGYFLLHLVTRHPEHGGRTLTMNRTKVFKDKFIEGKAE